MARFAAPLLFGLLVGGLLGAAAMGFLFDGAGGEDARALEGPIGPAARATPASDLLAPPVAEAAPAPAGVERSVEPLSDSAAPADVVASLGEVARAARPPSPRGGSRSIRGRVAQPDGSPVAGAIVRATRRGESTRSPGRSQTGAAAPAPESLEVAVRRAVEAWYDRNSDARETATDADGRFAFDDLGGDRYSLAAWCEGFDVRARGNTLVRPDATFDFVAERVIRLEVDVRLPDGSAPPRAALQVRGAGESSWTRTEAWTPQAADVACVAGEWEVRASLGDPESGPAWPDCLVSKPQRVTLVDGVAAAPISLRLAGSPGIRGEVRFAGDPANPRAFVRIAPLAAGREPDLKGLAQDHAGTHEWAHDGRFTFQDLARGRWVVAASRGFGDRILAHRIVEVADSMVVVDLEIPPSDPDSAVRVTVLDPDGKPLHDVRFSLEISTEGWSSSGGVEAERQQDGSFLVPIELDHSEVDLSEAWTDATEVTLETTSKRYGTESTAITSSTRTLEIRFGPPARLHATVLGYEGSGYEGRLQLALAPVTDEDEPMHRMHMGGDGLGADGAREFGPVRAGVYRLILSARNENERWASYSEVESIDVTLAPGDNRASIAIPALYALEIEFPGATEGNASISPRDEAKQRFSDSWTEISPQGIAAFEALRAGEYVVSAWAGEMRGEMTVTVPTSGRVRFVPEPDNALVINIEDEGGQLAAAGFEAGDVVIAVDGREFADVAALSAALTEALGRESVTITVHREGEPIELKVAGKALANPFELGGGFWPSRR